MPFASEWLYRRLGRFYIWAFVAFEIVSALTIALGTLGIFLLYTEEISFGEFLRVLVVTEAVVLVAILFTVKRTWRGARPLVDWLKHGKPAEGALVAWRTAATFPRRFVVEGGWQPFLLVAIPIAVYATIDFDLQWYNGGFIFAGALVAVAYAAVLHFFAAELTLRPIMRDAVERLPGSFAGQPVGVPLRWKLFGALPLINVITGVVVSGLSSTQRSSLADLGLDVAVAIGVAFTISLELTLLVTKSILNPVNDLIEATDRVKGGDLSARVPVLSGDELGALAGSFNEMLRGLEERERLREAFGSYVDPEVAQRVLRDGAILEGEEVEVSVLFVDIRDFTPFAENASAREAVGRLKEFFGIVVPLLMDHGGHANKFIGDGVLGVFGAPERVPDHADRAVEAACAIASALEDRFAVGIGVNSGPVLAGSIGGGGRLEFTVIGDPVNVAARVERMTRETGDVVLITEATRCLLTREGIAVEERGSIPLKGRTDPVCLYAPRIELPKRPVPAAAGQSPAS
jgi:adenylate cyclase